MIWLVFLASLAAANAAKLNNAYLPPPNAKDAGGRDDDLQVPLEPPYIDPYSDNRHLFPGRHNYGRGYGSRRNPSRAGDEEDGFWAPGKSRFLYGSYSYIGPDNVLVTVTYKADKRRPKSKSNDDDYNDYDFGGPGGYGYNADDDYGNTYAGTLEGGVVPTPPSLPNELRKAYAFHRKKYRPVGKDGSKDIKTPTPGSRSQPWTEQPPQTPVIHQGYSYPKTAYNISS